MDYIYFPTSSSIEFLPYSLSFMIQKLYLMQIL